MRFARSLVAMLTITCHNWRMSDNPTYPYTLDVSEKPGGQYQWAIRERGRLIQRSDRPHFSERDARQKGEAAVESLFAKSRNDRFR
jgi:hypothetical protein